MQLSLGRILTLVRFFVPPGNPVLCSVKDLYGGLILELQKQLTGDVLGTGAAGPELRAKNSL